MFNIDDHIPAELNLCMEDILKLKRETDKSTLPIKFILPNGSEAPEEGRKSIIHTYFKRRPFLKTVCKLLTSVHKDHLRVVIVPRGEEICQS